MRALQFLQSSLTYAWQVLTCRDLRKSGFIYINSFEALPVIRLILRVSERWTPRGN